MKPNLEELLHDRDRGGIALKSFIFIEAHQVLHGYISAQLEELIEKGEIILMISEIALIHLYLEMNAIFCMVLSEAEDLCISLLHDLLEVLLVVFGPFVYRELFDVDGVVLVLIDLEQPFYLVVAVLFTSYLADVAFVPRMQLGEGSITVQALNYHSCYVSWIIVRDICAPT